MTTVVYGKDSCRQCDATTRKLDTLKAKYDYVNLSDNHEALELIKELGYLQAPVVVTPDKHWSGYRPDLIELHVK